MENQDNNVVDLEAPNKKADGSGDTDTGGEPAERFRSYQEASEAAERSYEKRHSGHSGAENGDSEDEGTPAPDMAPKPTFPPLPDHFYDDKGKLHKFETLYAPDTTDRGDQPFDDFQYD